MSESQTGAGNLKTEQLLFSCLGSKVTVFSRKLQWFFSTDIRVHRAGSQLKNVRKSDRRWEPENFENLKTLKTLSLGHAEQLLFSCLGSKVTLSLSHSLTLTLFQSLIQSLLTC